MGSRNVRNTHNKHLNDPAVAAEYINNALETEDPAVVLMAIRNVVDAQENGIAGVAQKSELGRESMYKMLSAKGNPKLSTLTALLHGLGLRMVIEPEMSTRKAPEMSTRKAPEMSNRKAV